MFESNESFLFFPSSNIYKEYYGCILFFFGGGGGGVQSFNEVCFLEKGGGEELCADNTLNGVI